MNAGYRAYVDLGRTLAEQRALQWSLPLEPDGRVRKGHGWNLTTLAGDVPPPTHYLNHLGRDAKMRQALAEPSLEAAPLSGQAQHHGTHRWQHRTALAGPGHLSAGQGALAVDGGGRQSRR